MNARKKPKLGQHFLIDESVVSQIINLADLPNDATVVEIGPGTGVLTRALNAAVPNGQILAIEVDGTLAFHLRERVSKRVKIIHADALRFDYNSVAKPYHVVSNLPYQITSPILHTLISSANPPETMTLMMQREVAERLLAPPKTRERGLLTMVVAWYGTVESGFDVPPSAFNPPPEVWSTVVRLVRFNHDKIPPNLPLSKGGVPLFTKEGSGEILARPPFQPFLNFLKVGFSQKRRQIHHPLVTRFPMLKDQMDQLLGDVGIERTQRAEELTFEQWVKLFNCFMEAIKQ